MSMINPSTSASSSLNTSSLSKKELSQESFMKLLLTQLKMQNPLNPFDASTMMQQISQLTGLSASQSLAKSVDAFKSNLGTSQVLEASKLVGKEIQVASKTMQLNEAHEAKGSVTVPSGVNSIEIAVCDSSGKPVRTIKLAANEGTQDFSWNGLDDSGKPLDPGFYTFSAKGLNTSGESLTLETTTTVKVSSVALDKTNNVVILNVDGLGGISMNDVVKIL